MFSWACGEEQFRVASEHRDIHHVWWMAHKEKQKWKWVIHNGVEMGKKCSIHHVAAAHKENKQKWKWVIHDGAWKWVKNVLCHTCTKVKPDQLAQA